MTYVQSDYIAACERSVDGFEWALSVARGQNDPQRITAAEENLAWAKHRRDMAITQASE